MDIIERGRAFLQSLRALARRSGWEWRRCPRCGETDTWRHGTYTRQPRFLAGRQRVVVQRHWCRRCRRTYSERSALLVRGSHYAREVHRCAIDLWQHGGSSLRRTAELVRSLCGHQERWRLWRPLDPDPAPSARCRLEGSTVGRWLDRAGRQAHAGVADQLAGVPSSGQLGTDGLWARLRGGARRVLLLLSDSVTGVVWPPVVVTSEDDPAAWGAAVERAALAGLDPDTVRGLTSDGSTGLARFLDGGLSWVNHQRCVWHLWRGLAGKLAHASATAAAGLAGAAATAVRRATRRTLVELVRAGLDAATLAQAEAALATLAAHPLGRDLATALWPDLDAALVYRVPYNRGLVRTGPEWYWRDFRLRLGHGRNHGSADRLERAALLWAVYRNATPAQWRTERKRHYRRPGQSPLAAAGVPPGAVSYLDMLAV